MPPSDGNECLFMKACLKDLLSLSLLDERQHLDQVDKICAFAQLIKSDRKTNFDNINLPKDVKTSFLLLASNALHSYVSGHKMEKPARFYPYIDEFIFLLLDNMENLDSNEVPLTCKILKQFLTGTTPSASSAAINEDLDTLRDSIMRQLDLSSWPSYVDLPSGLTLLAPVLKPVVESRETISDLCDSISDMLGGKADMQNLDIGPSDYVESIPRTQSPIEFADGVNETYTTSLRQSSGSGEAGRLQDFARRCFDRYRGSDKVMTLIDSLSVVQRSGGIDVMENLTLISSTSEAAKLNTDMTGLVGDLRLMLALLSLRQVTPLTTEHLERLSRAVCSALALLIQSETASYLLSSNQIPAVPSNNQSDTTDSQLRTLAYVLTIQILDCSRQCTDAGNRFNDWYESIFDTLSTRIILVGFCHLHRLHGNTNSLPSNSVLASGSDPISVPHPLLTCCTAMRLMVNALEATKRLAGRLENGPPDNEEDLAKINKDINGFMFSRGETWHAADLLRYLLHPLDDLFLDFFSLTQLGLLQLIKEDDSATSSGAKSKSSRSTSPEDNDGESGGNRRSDNDDVEGPTLGLDILFNQNTTDKSPGKGPTVPSRTRASLTGASTTGGVVTSAIVSSSPKRGGSMMGEAELINLCHRMVDNPRSSMSQCLAGILADKRAANKHQMNKDTSRNELQVAKRSAIADLATSLMQTLDQLVLSDAPAILRSRVTEQSIKALAKLIQELDADAISSKEGSLLPLQSHVTSLIHHLLLHQVLSIEGQESLLGHLGLSPNEPVSPSGPHWPLYVPVRSLACLADVLIVMVTHASSSTTVSPVISSLTPDCSKTSVDNLISGVWNRFVAALGHALHTGMEGNTVSTTDVNVEHMQVLVFLLGSLSSLTNKKAVLSSLVNLVVELGTVDADIMSSLFHRLWISRLFLLIKYMLVCFYDQPPQLAKQIRYNLFASWFSAGSDSTLRRRDSSKQAFFYPDLRDINIEAVFTTATETSPLTSHTHLYDVMLEEEFGSRKKPDALALSVLVNRPNYGEFLEETLSLLDRNLGPYSNQLAKSKGEHSNEIRGHLVVTFYHFLIGWRILAALPPSGVFLKQLLDQIQNKMEAGFENAQPARVLYLLALAPRLNEETTQELVQKSLASSQVEDAGLIQQCLSQVFTVPHLVSVVLRQLSVLSENLTSWQQGGDTPSVEQLVFYETVIEFLDPCLCDPLTATQTKQGETGWRSDQTSLLVDDVESMVTCADSVFKIVVVLLHQFCVITRQQLLKMAKEKDACDEGKADESLDETDGWYHFLCLWPTRLDALPGCNKSFRNRVAALVPRQLVNSIDDWQYNLTDFPDKTDKRMDVSTLLSRIYQCHFSQLHHVASTHTTASLHLCLAKRFIRVLASLVTTLAPWASPTSQRDALPTILALHCDDLLDRTGHNLHSAAEILLTTTASLQSAAVSSTNSTTSELKPVFEATVTRAVVQFVLCPTQTAHSTLLPIQVECLALLTDDCAAQLAATMSMTSLPTGDDVQGVLAKLLLAGTQEGRSVQYRVAIFNLVNTVLYMATKSGSKKSAYTSLVSSLAPLTDLADSTDSKLSAWIVSLLSEGQEELRTRLDQFVSLVVGDWTTDENLKSEICQSLIKHVLSIETTVVKYYTTLQDAVKNTPPSTSVTLPDITGLPDLIGSLCRLAGGCAGASGHSSIIQSLLEWTYHLGNCVQVNSTSETLVQQLPTVLTSLMSLYSYLSNITCSVNPDYSTADCRLSPNLYADSSVIDPNTSSSSLREPFCGDADSDEESDEDSLDELLCTYSASQKEYVEQHWYNCHTCGMQEVEGVCSVCALVCHRGHELSYAKKGGFFCDCGAKGEAFCSALSPRHSNSGGARKSVKLPSSSSSTASGQHQAWGTLDPPVSGHVDTSSLTKRSWKRLALRRKTGTSGAGTAAALVANATANRRAHTMVTTATSTTTSTMSGEKDVPSSREEESPGRGEVGTSSTGSSRHRASVDQIIISTLIEDMRNKIGEDREILSVLLTTSPLLRDCLDMLERMEPLLMTHYQSLATGGLDRLQQAFTKLHTESKTTIRLKHIVTKVVDTQEDAKEATRGQTTSSGTAGTTPTSGSDSGLPLRSLLPPISAQPASSSGGVSASRRVATALLSFLPPSHHDGLGVVGGPSVPRRRYFLCIGHDKTKFSVVSLGDALKQAAYRADNKRDPSLTTGQSENYGKRKVNIAVSSVSTASVVNVVSMAANTDNEQLLAVCGLKECAVYAVTSQGIPSLKVKLSPVLENNDTIVRPVWLPGSSTQVALLCAHSVQIFDLSLPEGKSPLYHFQPVEGKFRDLTFVAANSSSDNSANGDSSPDLYMLVMALSGCILCQKLGPDCLATQGCFYLADTLEWDDGQTWLPRDNGTGSIGYGGLSLYYSHSLQMLFHSYMCGKTLITSIDPQKLTVKKSFLLDIKGIGIGASNGTSSATTTSSTTPAVKCSPAAMASNLSSALLNWAEVPGHPGLLSAMTHTSCVPVLVSVEPGRFGVQEVKINSGDTQISASFNSNASGVTTTPNSAARSNTNGVYTSRNKVVDAVTLRTAGSHGRTFSVVLAEDGGLTVHASKSQEELECIEAIDPCSPESAPEGTFWLQPGFRYTTSILSPSGLTNRRSSSISKSGDTSTGGSALGRPKDRCLLETAEEGKIPVDFFEHAKLTFDISFGGQALLHLYNSEQLKRRLRDPETPVACARPGGFSLEIKNESATKDTTIAGLRLGLNAADPDKLPQYVVVFGRRIDIGRITKSRSFDIPFYRSEMMLSDKKVVLTVGRSSDAHHITQIDWVHVYLRTKESIGWPIMDSTKCTTSSRHHQTSTATTTEKLLADLTHSLSSNRLSSSAILTKTLSTSSGDVLLPGPEFVASAVELVSSMIHLSLNSGGGMGDLVTTELKEEVLARGRGLVSWPAPPCVVEQAAGLLSVVMATDEQPENEEKRATYHFQMDRLVRLIKTKDTEGEALDPVTFQECLKVTVRVIQSALSSLPSTPLGTTASAPSAAHYLEGLLHYPATQLVGHFMTSLFTLLAALPSNPWTCPLDRVCLRNVGQIVCGLVRAVHGMLVITDWLGEAAEDRKEVFSALMEIFFKLLLHPHPLVSQSARDTLVHLTRPIPVPQPPVSSQKTSDQVSTSPRPLATQFSTGSKKRRKSALTTSGTADKVWGASAVPEVSRPSDTTSSTNPVRQQASGMGADELCELFLDDFLPPGIEVVEDEDDDEDEDEDDEDDEEDEGDEDDIGMGEAALLLESLQSGGNSDNMVMMQAIMDHVNDQDLLNIAMQLSLQEQEQGSNPAADSNNESNPPPLPTSNQQPASVPALPTASEHSTPRGTSESPGEMGTEQQNNQNVAAAESDEEHDRDALRESDSSSSDSSEEGEGTVTPSKSNVVESNEISEAVMTRYERDVTFLHNFRLSLLTHLTEAWHHLETVDGLRAVPFFQIVQHLIKELDIDSNNTEKLAFEAVVNHTLSFLNLPTRDPESLIERTENSEVMLIHFKFLTHLLTASKSGCHSPPKSTQSVPRSKESGSTEVSSSTQHTSSDYMTQYTLAHLIANNCPDFSLRVIGLLHNLWRKEAPDQSSTSSSVIHASPLYGYVDLSPFFPPRQHGGEHDPFAQFVPMVTEIVLRVPYTMLKTMTAAPQTAPTTDIQQTEPETSAPSTSTGTATKHKSRQHSDLGPFRDERWAALLCEFIELVPANHLKKQIKRLLMLMVGNRYYRQLRDIHLTGRTMHSIQTVCLQNGLHMAHTPPVPADTPPVANDATGSLGGMSDNDVALQRINIPYLTLCELVEKIKICKEVASSRTQNWQRFLLKCPDMLLFLFQAMIALDPFVSEHLLSLLDCALCRKPSTSGPTTTTSKSQPSTAPSTNQKSGGKKDEQAKKDKSKKSQEKSSSNRKSRADSSETGLEVKLCQTLSQLMSKEALVHFIRLYLCRAVSFDTRWTAENILHSLASHADPAFEQTLLDLLWQLWPEVAEFAPKAAQYLDLLGYMLLKTASYPAPPSAFATGASVTTGPEVVMPALVATLKRQNQILAKHPNSLIYTAMQKWIDLEGFYLESDPCQVCHELSDPLSLVKWDSEPMDSKRSQGLPKGYIDPHTRSNPSTHVFKLKNSYTISSVHVKFNLVSKRQRFVRTLNLYYSNSDVKTPVKMRNRTDLWIKAKKVSIAKDQTEVQIDLPVPITACYLIFDYTEFYPPPAGEKVHCPRCHIPVEGGICPHCKDNVNQCFKCRSINLNQRDAYLCTYCNSCRYGKIEFTINARPCSQVEPISSDDDRTTQLSQITGWVDQLDRKGKSVSLLRQKVDHAVTRLIERDTDETTGPASKMSDTSVTTAVESKVHQVWTSVAAGASVGPQQTGASGPSGEFQSGPNTNTHTVHRDVQTLAMLYYTEAKPLFLEYNALALQVMTARRAVVEYNQKQRQLTASLTSQAMDDLPNRVEEHPVVDHDAGSEGLCTSSCYGCAVMMLRRCVWLLSGLATCRVYRGEMAKHGLAADLVEGGSLYRGGNGLRKDIRQLVCQLTKDMPDQVQNVNGIIEAHISCLLTHQSLNPDLEWILRQDMILLRSSASIKDSCWEMRIRLVLRLLLRYQHRCSPVVIKTVLLPCFRLLYAYIKTATPQLGPLADALATPKPLPTPNTSSTVVTDTVAPISGAVEESEGASTSASQEAVVKVTSVVDNSGASGAMSSKKSDMVSLRGGKVTVDLKAWMQGWSNAGFQSWLSDAPKASVSPDSPPPKQSSNQGDIRARYIEEKFWWRWRDAMTLKRRRRSQPDALSLGASLTNLSANSWIRESLFAPTSLASRQCSCALLESIAMSGPERKAAVLKFLVQHCLDDLEFEGGEAGDEFAGLLKRLSASEPWCSHFLVVKCGLLTRLHELTSRILASLNRLENVVPRGAGSASQRNLCALLYLLVYFVGERGEKVRGKSRDRLIGQLLKSYVEVKRVVIGRNRVTTGMERSVVQLMEKLCVEPPEQNVRQFIKIALETVAQYPLSDYEPATIIFDRLCAIIKPADYEHPSFSIVLETFKGQEEYLFGRMTGIALRSDTPGLGPRIRDVRQFICEENGFDSFFMENDFSLQILVGNNILAPDLLLEDVYQLIWLRTTTNKNLPMKLIYRIGGMDDDPDEQHLESLSKVVLKTEAEVEEYYRKADVLAEDGGMGLRVLLERLSSVRELVLGHSLMEILLRLLDYCMKKKVNREMLGDPTLKAVPILLHALTVCLCGAQGSTDESLRTSHEMARSVLDVLAIVLRDAGKASAEVRAQFAQQTGDLPALLKLLNQIYDHRHLEIYQNGVSKILPLLAFGVEEKIGTIIDFFLPYLNFIKLDSNFSEVDRNVLTCFCSVTAGVPDDANGLAMKDALLSRGVVKTGIEYLLSTAPSLDPAQVKLDSDEMKHFLGRRSLPLVLQVLRGSCGSHREAGDALNEAGVIAFVHHLETSTGVKGIGSLAEDLVDEVSKCGGKVADTLSELRRKTREEKRKKAMASRQRQLHKLNMVANAKGQVKLKESAAAKLEYLNEESGLVCSVCREGYRYQPTKPLGIYTFTKKCPLEEAEAKENKSMGYTTVSNFTVIHHACHTQALQNSKEGEWKVARRHNGDVKCNGLLPLYGPQIQEGVFVNNLAKHNNYLSGFRDISYISSVHDVKLLLLRFAHERSLSVDSEGGGRESNMQLVPYLMMLALHTMPATMSVMKEVEALNAFVAAPPEDPSSKWLESSWDVLGPLFRCTMALHIWTPQEWAQHRVTLLRRIIVLAHARATLTPGASKMPAEETDPGRKVLPDFTSYRPYLIFIGLVDGFYRLVFKMNIVKLHDDLNQPPSYPPPPPPTAGTPTDAPATPTTTEPPVVKKEGPGRWTEALTAYIRANDVAIVEDCKKMVEFYESDLLPTASFIEFLDVTGFLPDISNPNEFIQVTLDSLPKSV